MDTRTGLPVVGMVGGGQLARMTHQAAIALGQSLRVLAASPEDGAVLVAADVQYGDHTDLAALRTFAKGCDVVTFDHEHVPTEAVRELAASGAPVPRWRPISSVEDVRAFGNEVGWPVVVKAVRGGYAGRGVWMLTLDDPLP